MSASTLYPAQLSGRDIRLLQVEPGEQSSMLQCRLLQASLEDTSPYYALSYVWGEAKIRKHVMCNGCLVETTTNLYSVLSEYRQRAVAVRLWVDALCINQSDNYERTSQVRMMQEIYERAEKVIIWLGDKHEEDEVAIDTLKLINAPWATHEGIPLFTGQNIAAYDMWLSSTLSNQSLQAVSVFLQRPWFQRIWIVQELISANSIAVWCGALTLDPDVLSGAGRSLSMHNVTVRLQVSTPNQSGLSRLRLACAGRLVAIQQTKRDMRLGIYDLLMITRYFMSTEPRDKVFALVGLAYDIDSSFVDYSLDFRSVMINLSERFLNGQTQPFGHPLDILSCVTGFSAAKASIPSWVVDWSILSESLFTPLSLGYPSETDLTSHAPSIHLTSDKILHVEGIIVDQIKEAVESPAHIQRLVSSSELLDGNAAYKLHDWHVHCCKVVYQLPEYPTGETKYDAFWRTLMCNRDFIGSVNPPEDDTSYLAWVKLVNAQVNTLNIDARTERIKQVGVVASYVIVPFLVTRFLSTWTGKWRILTPAIISVTYAFQRTWQAWLGFLKTKLMLEYYNHQIENQKLQRQFEACFSEWSQGRRFCTTKTGHIGWVPTAAEKDDHIVLFRGCRIPFALRPYQDGYKLIGDCYIHGFMDGVPSHVTKSNTAIKIY